MANTLKNRRFRVNQLLRTPKSLASTKRLRRQSGKRYLVKPTHLRFNTTVNNNNNNNTWNTYSNNNINYLNALVESRKSILPSRPQHRNVSLSPNQAVLFANLSAKYNNPSQMLNALNRKNIPNKNRNTFRKKIYALYN